MDDTDLPIKFAIPWANGASGSFIRPIPQASQIGIQNGAASLTDGFPPNCFLPIGAGGSWPFAQDFNGILNQMTKWDQWIQAGGPIVYDATFQASIGGYPNGAVVVSATTAGLNWRSVVDNNVTNPDSGGAGWVFAISGLLIGFQIFSANGTYTPATGMLNCYPELQGGGGAGGGTGVTGPSSAAAGGGGGAGAYAKGKFSKTDIGSSKIVTIGAAGLGQVSFAGQNGGATSLGSLIIAPGGTGGGVGAAISATPAAGGSGGAPSAAPTGGNIESIPGFNGGFGLVLNSGSSVNGLGAPSRMGSYGCGGTGANAGNSQAAQAGFNGQIGKMIIWEYS